MAVTMGTIPVYLSVGEGERCVIGTLDLNAHPAAWPTLGKVDVRVTSNVMADLLEAAAAEIRGRDVGSAEPGA